MNSFRNLIKTLIGNCKRKNDLNKAENQFADAIFNFDKKSKNGKVIIKFKEKIFYIEECR